MTGPSTTLSPPSPTCIRVLRKSTHRTDVVYQPKRRAPRKKKQAGTEGQEATSSRMPPASTTDVRKGKKRAREDDEHEVHPLESPRKRQMPEPLALPQGHLTEPRGQKESLNPIVENSIPAADPQAQVKSTRRPGRPKKKATKKKKDAKKIGESMSDSNGLHQPGPSTSTQPGPSNLALQHPPPLAPPPTLTHPPARRPLGLGGLKRTTTFLDLGKPSGR